MIEVRIFKEFRKDYDRLSGFSMKGHANSDIRGKDLVCCAASTLAINTINAITEVLKIDKGLDLHFKSGLLELRVEKSEDSEKEKLVQFALEVFQYNISKLKEQYPQYFQIETKKGI